MKDSSFCHEAGKGSRQRKVDKQKYNDNWDAIFKKNNEDKKPIKEEEGPK